MTSTKLTAQTKPTPSDGAACPWCTKRFKARRGGTRQRFCSARCRTAFWSALRRSGERELAAGTLSIDAVRNGRLEACTLRRREETPPPCPEIGSPPQPSPEPLKRFSVLIPESLIQTLIFRHFAICFYERDDLPALLAALGRLGHKPKITETSEHVTVLSF
jgi:hypothetical protein